MNQVTPGPAPKSTELAPQELEMWGGIECTVNRVHDDYFTQMERSGHAERISDLQAFAELGIRAIRYPVLWERTGPEADGAPDWAWTDERLTALRGLGIRPIAGLTHHGSGPRYTSLVDPKFPEQMAKYARAVAERYPFLEDYTPVNEPLTTAAANTRAHGPRFSGLYGHWYPHGRDDRTFLRTLVTECRAVILAMQAIREVTPGARLIQTEDLGRVYSTPRLAHIAELSNARRWLSLDLLCGRVTATHRLRNYLRKYGISDEEVAFFEEHPCPPDIIGVNHYLTSDRFLDEGVARYPRRQHEQIAAYADVEAVRARLELPIGACTILAEAAERYGRPVAVTEAHLGGTREEQLRWLYEIWTSAQRLLKSGVDARAVTVWSLLGAFDWNVLVTRLNGFYEPGVFDVRAPQPRPTALARLVRDLATQSQPTDEPLLEQPGWWRRPDRLFREPSTGRTAPRVQTKPPAQTFEMRNRSSKPLLILGGNGTLGRAFVRLCHVRGIPYHLAQRNQIDLAAPVSARDLILETNAWAVVNAAGYVRVDDAEREPELVMAVNATGPAAIASACSRVGIPFLSFSSDLVFDGARRDSPYTESDAVAPLGVYGRSKAAMEEQVLANHPAALVVRTSSFFGPWDGANFVTRAIYTLVRKGEVTAANDLVVSPTYVPDLVNASLDLLIDRERGIWHLANEDALTWNELALRAAKLVALPTDGIHGKPARELEQLARRPRYSALASERGWIMPSLDDALSRYVRELELRKPDPLAA